jgi:hypothetical protein
MVAVAVVEETKLASKMRYSVPRRLRTITRSREGGVAFAGDRSPSVRTTAPSVGVVCSKWVRALLASCLWIYCTSHYFPFCARNIAIRPPLSLDGRKMHRASLLAITESNGHPVPLHGVITHCARETEHCSAGLPDVSLFPSLPRIRHLPGSIRLCGMHSGARFCV